MTAICQICLCSGITLRELNDSLLSYYHGLCDYKLRTGFSKHLCCSPCEDALKNNLYFKNKCLEASKILRLWKKNKCQNKPSIQSLHELLQTSYKDKCIEINKCENTKDSYKINDTCTNYEEKSIISSENDKIKIEIVKDEVKNDDAFEIIDCGAENDEINHDSTGNDDGGITHESFDNESDDDKFLIDCVSETKDVSSKKPKKEKAKLKLKSRKSKNKTIQKQEKRVRPRKGLSEYSQYEDVFDIQLFSTDEEARSEVSQRRVSEPYLSAAHRCELCYTVYKCDKLLHFHMKWHDSSAKFECDICSMRFSVLKSLQCHKVKCHRGKFTCKLCPLITYYGSAMKAHFQKHQGKIFKCHCGGVFVHISSYLSHKRTVHASSHVCVTCARTFISEHGLLHHRIRMHQTKCKEDSNASSRCEPCGLTFASQQVYNIHVLNTDAHADIAASLIACPYCGLSFDGAAQLKAHKKQNHPKKQGTNDTITCKLCGAEGQGRVWRRRHYSAAHPTVRYLEEVSEAKVHMCERCGKRFSNICMMKDHINTHLGLKPYACESCRKAFSSASARAAHAELHAPPRRACAHCGAVFRSASNLAAHMLTHGGTRRHVCACGKAFLHRAALREHERGVHAHVRRTRTRTRTNQPTTVPSKT